jgi:hypothetical protein
MVKVFKVGDRVVGKTKGIDGQCGTIEEGGLGPKQSSFRVKWENGRSGIYTAWAIDIDVGVGQKRRRAEADLSHLGDRDSESSSDESEEDSSGDEESQEWFESETEALEADR